MTYPKILAVAILVIGLSLEATATSTTFTINNGTFAANAAKTTISLSPASMLTLVNGPPCSPVCSGNLGTVTMLTAPLTSGSLQFGGMFGAGGMLTITGNGTNGVPSGTLFQGTFSSGTWTVNPLPVGNDALSFTGTLKGTGSFSDIPAFTIHSSKIVHGNPFAGVGAGSVAWASGNTTVGVVPEPGTLSLMGTGILGIAAGIRRRKLLKT